MSDDGFLCVGKAPKPDFQKCALCGKPLSGAGLGTWTDDEEYGDVHESCLEEKQSE